MIFPARPLTLGYSTCPNDTFLFHALAHRRIDMGDLRFDITLADVETLNRDAERSLLDVTKLSFAALGHLRDRYGLLRSGAALGRGCGPLVVARPGFDPGRLGRTPIAVPGLRTTAHLLLGLYLGETPPAVPMTFDLVMPAVLRGEFEAGVIIHEGRFTYENQGLEKVVDLGEWWEAETGLPLPLGGIAIRRDLGPQVARAVEKAIRESVIHAFAHPSDSAEYVRTHAMELSDEVTRRHIDLYVNEFTRDLGPQGERAVAALLDGAVARGLMPASSALPFAG